MTAPQLLGSWPPLGTVGGQANTYVRLTASPRTMMYVDANEELAL